MRLPVLAAALLTFLANGPAALAQDDERSPDEMSEIFDRGCGDDDGNDRCSSDVQRRMRELYGIPDAATLVEQGVTFRRAMFVDGYGRDFVAITFSRAPGRSPSVEIVTPLREGGSMPQPLAAVIDQVTWSRVLAASEFFDKRVEGETLRGQPNPEAPSSSAEENERDDEQTIVICLHAWFVVVEAADAARLQKNVGAQRLQRASFRRDSEGGCAGGLAMPYAFLLAETALDNLPECSSLDLDYERHAATLLGTCNRLGGDRLAAGDAMKLVRELEGRNSDLPQGREFGWLFAASARELAEPLRAAVSNGNAGLYFDAPHASDVDHATVKGEVVFWGEGDSPDERADLTLTLIRQLDEFKILSYELGERKPGPAS